MIKRSMRLPILPNLSTFVTLHCGHVITWRRVFPVGKRIPARTAKFPNDGAAIVKRLHERGGHFVDIILAENVFAG
jgi:hypothetical protein